MTLLRVLVLSIAFVGFAESFPTTTKDYVARSTTELETKGTTDPIPVHTEDPQAMLDMHNNSELESSIVEFASENTREGIQGSEHEKYTIVNLPTKYEDEKLNLVESSKENEIDIDGKDKLNKLNITDISQNEDLLSEAQIKRDQWLFDPQETSSITGGIPKYLYDAIKPIQPFPELSDILNPRNRFSELSEIAKPFHHVPELIEKVKTNQTLPALVGKAYDSFYESLGGLPLFPKSAALRDIDDPFYVI